MRVSKGRFLICLYTPVSIEYKPRNEDYPKNSTDEARSALHGLLGPISGGEETHERCVKVVRDLDFPAAKALLPQRNTEHCPPLKKGRVLQSVDGRLRAVYMLLVGSCEMSYSIALDRLEPLYAAIFVVETGSWVTYSMLHQQILNNAGI